MVDTAQNWNTNQQNKLLITHEDEIDLIATAGFYCNQK